MKKAWTYVQKSWGQVGYAHSDRVVPLHSSSDPQYLCSVQFYGSLSRRSLYMSISSSRKRKLQLLVFVLCTHLYLDQRSLYHSKTNPSERLYQFLISLRNRLLTCCAHADNSSSLTDSIWSWHFNSSLLWLPGLTCFDFILTDCICKTPYPNKVTFWGFGCTLIWGKHDSSHYKNLEHIQGSINKL